MRTLTGALSVWNMRTVLKDIFVNIGTCSLIIGQWTWVSGSNTNAKPGTYGTKGVPDAANVPGAHDAQHLVDRQQW